MTRHQAPGTGRSQADAPDSQRHSRGGGNPGYAQVPGGWRLIGHREPDTEDRIPLPSWCLESGVWRLIRRRAQRDGCQSPARVNANRPVHWMNRAVSVNSRSAGSTGNRPPDGGKRSSAPGSGLEEPGHAGQQYAEDQRYHSREEDEPGREMPVPAAPQHHETHDGQDEARHDENQVPVIHGSLQAAERHSLRSTR